MAEVLTQLAGFEAPARAWEAHILPRRVRDYQREWLDEVTMSGEFAWGRLWGGAGSAIRVTPIAIVPREQLDDWLSLAAKPKTEGMSGPAADLLRAMTAGGPMFPQSLPEGGEAGAGPRRNGPGRTAGPRVDHLRFVRRRAADDHAAVAPAARVAAGRPLVLLPLGCRRRRTADELNEMIARQLLRRTGVVFRRTLDREKIPVTWSALRRVYRRMELRGEIRGGRFVAGFSGEQFALPQAVELLRRLRRQGPRQPIATIAADPLNFEGILTPAEGAEPASILRASIA